MEAIDTVIDSAAGRNRKNVLHFTLPPSPIAFSWLGLIEPKDDNTGEMQPGGTTTPPIPKRIRKGGNDMRLLQSGISVYSIGDHASKNILICPQHATPVTAESWN